MDQEALEHQRELFEAKLATVSDSLSTFRKQVLGNGQPGELDRMRTVISDVRAKSDERNKLLWAAVDELREDRVDVDEIRKLQGEVESLKQQRWMWAGATGAILTCAELALHFLKG